MGSLPTNTLNIGGFHRAKIGKEWFANFYYAESDSYYGLYHESRGMAQRMARSNVPPHVVAYRVRVIKRDPSTYLDRLLAAAEYNVRQAAESGDKSRLKDVLLWQQSINGRRWLAQANDRLTLHQNPHLTERDPHWADRTEGFTETACSEAERHVNVGDYQEAVDYLRNDKKIQPTDERVGRLLQKVGEERANGRVDMTVAVADAMLKGVL